MGEIYALLRFLFIIISIIGMHHGTHVIYNYQFNDAKGDLVLRMIDGRAHDLSKEGLANIVKKLASDLKFSNLNFDKTLKLRGEWGQSPHFSIFQF